MHYQKYELILKYSSNALIWSSLHVSVGVDIA